MTGTLYTAHSECGCNNKINWYPMIYTGHFKWWCDKINKNDTLWYMLYILIIEKIPFDYMADIKYLCINKINKIKYVVPCNINWTLNADVIIK